MLDLKEVPFKGVVASSLSKIEGLFGIFTYNELEDGHVIIEATLDVSLGKFLLAIKDNELLLNLEEVAGLERELGNKSLFQMANKINPITFREILDIEKPENLVLLNASELERYNDAKEHLGSSRPLPVIQLIYHSGEESSIIVNFRIGANKMSPMRLATDSEVSLLGFLETLFFVI